MILHNAVVINTVTTLLILTAFFGSVKDNTVITIHNVATYAVIIHNNVVSDTVTIYIYIFLGTDPMKGNTVINNTVIVHGDVVTNALTTDTACLPGNRSSSARQPRWPCYSGRLRKRLRLACLKQWGAVFSQPPVRH